MSKRVLIIGGTRNLGPSIARQFLEAGDTVTVLNRGLTPGELPQGVERLRADRADVAQMRAALGNREFDVVVDTTLYNAADARTTVELLNGRVGRYIFISTGQVYLVRLGLKRPYREADYAGPSWKRPRANARSITRTGSTAPTSAGRRMSSLRRGRTRGSPS